MIAADFSIPTSLTLGPMSVTMRLSDIAMPEWVARPTAFLLRRPLIRLKTGVAATVTWRWGQFQSRPGQVVWFVEFD